MLPSNVFVARIRHIVQFSFKESVRMRRILQFSLAINHEQSNFCFYSCKTLTTVKIDTFTSAILLNFFQGECEQKDSAVLCLQLMMSRVWFAFTTVKK